MKHHDFLKILSLSVLSALGCSSGGSVYSKAKRPNILLIMSDDMGFSDMGCYGGEIETPNLDGLANNGSRFTEFYSTGRCWPSRATLLSGRYSNGLTPNQVTIAQLLKTVGYQTGMVGKWHLSETATDENAPIQRGFDSYYGTLGGAGSYWLPPKLTRNTQAVVPDSQDYYYTEKIGDEAVKQIYNFAKPKKPFFQYVAFTAPHWPLHAREDVIKKYIKRYRKGWHALRQQRYQRMIEMGSIDEQRWPLPEPEPVVENWNTADHKDWRIRNMAVYAAMIDHMDQAIGRIVAALKDTGCLEDTLIIFTNDNGACSEHLSGNAWGTADNVLEWAKSQGKTISVGDNMDIDSGGPLTFHSVGRNWANAQNTPLRRYKANVHEGGACVPCIMHWPKGLKQSGKWIRQNANAIYGTRAGPWKPGKWGGSVYKDNTIYLHVLSMQGKDKLVLSGLNQKVLKTTIHGGVDVKYNQIGDKLEIVLPAEVWDEVDTIVELTLDAPVIEIIEQKLWAMLTG